jgi:hypothetical protein
MSHPLVRVEKKNFGYAFRVSNENARSEFLAGGNGENGGAMKMGNIEHATSNFELPSSGLGLVLANRELTGATVS